MTHNLTWWLIGKPIVDVLFALTELFSLCITVPELWGKMCTAQLVLQGSISLHSNFTWTGSTSINHSWHQKIRDTGLPMVKTTSLYVPTVWHNTGVWGGTDVQTDGRICHSMYCACKVSFAARCKNYGEYRHQMTKTAWVFGVDGSSEFGENLLQSSVTPTSIVVGC